MEMDFRMADFIFGDICAGIGGFSLGFERAGMKCAYQIEKDHFCQAVLTKHWPDVPKWKDLLEIKKGELPAVDLMAGGIPCQPHSAAGKQKGAADDRNLWPAYFQIIKWNKPKWIIIENVPGIKHTIFDNLVFDLEGISYAVSTLNIPVAGFNAPHLRYRYFIVGHADRTRLEIGKIKQENIQQKQPASIGASLSQRKITDTDRQQCAWTPEIAEQAGRQCTQGRNWWAAEPSLDRVVDGFPGRVVQCKALGNSIAPQIAEWLGRIILAVERKKL